MHKKGTPSKPPVIALIEKLENVALSTSPAVSFDKANM